jgi:hypothetical protein
MCSICVLFGKAKGINCLNTPRIFLWFLSLSQESYEYFIHNGKLTGNLSVFRLKYCVTMSFSSDCFVLAGYFLVLCSLVLDWLCPKIISVELAWRVLP